MGRPVAILLAFLAGMILPAQTIVDPLSLSSQPGVYRQDQLLVLTGAPGFSVRYRFVGAQVDGNYLAASAALALGALEGETRDYRISVQILQDDHEIEQRELRYTIDKTPPDEPEPDLAPGTWFQAISPVFSLPVGSGEDRIWSSWTGSDGSFQAVTEGGKLYLKGQSGSLVTYQVQVWAEDQVKQTSPTRIWNWTVDRRREREISEIPVFSPVEGRFQNPQYLYLDAQPFSQLRFTTDGSDPRSGQVYTGGTQLSQTGRVQLRIWGRTLLGTELERSINYESGTEHLAELDSGIWGQSHVVQFAGETYFYTAGERQPTSSDESLATPLRITPQAGALRGVALRLLRARDQAIFRYYLVLDGRQPQMPEVWARTGNPLTGRMETMQSGQAVQDALQLEIRSSDGSNVWYTINGKRPEADSTGRRPASERFVLPRADLHKMASADGFCTIQFQARQADGQWGPVNNLSVWCGNLPAAPVVRISPQADGSLQIQTEKSGGSIWYTVVSDYHGPGHRGPFRLPGAVRLELPFGAVGNMAFSFREMGKQGQIGPATPDETFRLANVAPDTPVIRISAARQVEISGSGKIRFRVLSEQAGAPSIVPQAALYTKPFVLKELAGANIAYVVEAWVEDGGGRTSGIARSEPIYCHTVNPAAPELAGEGGELFRNRSSFTLSIARPEPGIRYQYQLGAAGSTTDPGAASPWTERDIPIQRPEPEIVLELRVRAVSPLRPELVSPVSRFRLNILTLAPPAPTVNGVLDGQVSNQALEISLTGKVDGRLQYRLARGELVAETPWLDYRQPIQVPAPSDTDTTWRFQARLQDKAGNYSDPSTVRRFRILTRTPELPALQITDSLDNPVLPNGGNVVLSRYNLLLVRPVSPGGTIRMVLVDDRSKLRLPDLGAGLWGSNIPLEVEAGKSAIWYLQYCAYDEAGNASPASPIYTLTVDRDPPAAPDRPLILRQGNSGSLNWNAANDGEIEYMFAGSPQVSESPVFIAYKGTGIAWSLADGQDRLYLHYRSHDQAGNYSELQTMVIERSHQSLPPRIAGVEDGGLYNGPVNISVTDAPDNAITRYELTVGDQGRVEASSLSPILTSGMEIGPIAGETIKYHLSLRQFAAGAEPSDAVNIDFTIDRTPPRAPEIANFPAVTYSSRDITLNLQAEAGSRIWYGLLASDLPQSDNQEALDVETLLAQGEQVPAQEYDGTVLSLPGKPGRVMRYQLLAWAVDRAGNRSKASSAWQIFVDVDSLYVRDPMIAPSTEGALENGSRTEPFRDLERALQYAQKNGKNSLRLSAGRYPLRQAIELSGNMLISGGYSPDNWAPGGREATIIYPQAGFSDDTLLSSGSALSLRKIYLVDSGQALGSLVRMDSGRLEINASNLAVTRSERGILVNDGVLDISNSVVSCNDPLAVTLIELHSARCQLLATTLESTELPPILLKNQGLADYRLLSGQNSNITIRDSDLKPRRGLVTTAILLRGGSLDFSGKGISAGSGTLSATGVDISLQAKATLNNCRIYGETTAGNTVLLRAKDASLNLTECELVLQGNAGIYGVTAENVELKIGKSQIQAGKSLDFMTVLSAKNSQLEVTDSRISGTETADFRLASLQGGESLWRANTVQIRGGEALGGSGLVFLSHAGRNEFNGNTLSGDDQHTLFYLGSADGTLTVRSNIIEHWRFILQEAPDSLSRQSDADKGINSLQLLEGTRRQGSLFEGNKVRQGL